MKGIKSLLVKFALIFAVFTVATLCVSGGLIYASQMRIYKEEQETSIQEIATYLEKIIKDRDEAAAKFQAMFATAYPGKVLGVDVDFYELPEEMQEAYAVYSHMYYLLLFEQATKDFNIAYTYYITPFGPNPYTMCYVLDCVREERVLDGKMYIGVTDSIPEALDKHEKMWEAWETGLRPKGYDYYDNEYGRTYAYYTPLFIGETKAGVIGVEVEIASVDRGILKNSLRQTLWIALGLIVSVALLLIFINKRYISKIEHLADNVKSYAQNKDARIAREIESYGGGNDELSDLSNQTVAMILELDNYMRSLIATTRELTDTKEQAAALNELAHKDALTGIRNKTAYDKEVKKLEWEIADNKTSFGIAMIDLNFLKRINDTYGHEKGNLAIKKLCDIVCNIFEHSPVFRIGGDEFVVILKGRDYENISSLTQKINEQIDAMQKDASLEPWEKVSAAVGYALYDKNKDEGVENVFKRADKAMYARKLEMKAVRVN